MVRPLAAAADAVSPAVVDSPKLIEKSSKSFAGRVWTNIKTNVYETGVKFADWAKQNQAGLGITFAVIGLISLVLSVLPFGLIILIEGAKTPAGVNTAFKLLLGGGALSSFGGLYAYFNSLPLPASSQVEGGRA